MRLKSKISGIGDVELTRDSDDVGEISRAIDAHFDGMLYSGMPIEQARWIEAERERTHARLKTLALGELW